MQESVLLRQETNPRRPTTIHISAVNRLQASQYFQESRFARTIGTEEPHPLIVGETDGKLLEEYAGPKVF